MQKIVEKLTEKTILNYPIVLLRLNKIHRRNDAYFRTSDFHKLRVEEFSNLETGIWTLIKVYNEFPKFNKSVDKKGGLLSDFNLMIEESLREQPEWEKIEIFGLTENNRI